MIVIEVPVRGISKDNEKVMSRHGRYYKSRRFVEFERLVRVYASNAMRGKRMITGDVGLELQFYYRNTRHADLTNLPKGICDALSGIVYKDDRQIKEAKLSVAEDAEHESFIIKVYEV